MTGDPTLHTEAAARLSLGRDRVTFVEAITGTSKILDVGSLESISICQIGAPESYPVAMLQKEAAVAVTS